MRMKTLRLIRLKQRWAEKPCCARRWQGFGYQIILTLPQSIVRGLRFRLIQFVDPILHPGLAFLLEIIPGGQLILSQQGFDLAQLRGAQGGELGLRAGQGRRVSRNR